jgi:hypothetical protein
MNGTRCAINPATKATSRKKPVQLGNQDAALGCLCRCQGGGELRPAIKGISALPCFSPDIFADDRETFGLGKARDGGALGFDPEARAVLFLVETR